MLIPEPRKVTEGAPPRSQQQELWSCTAADRLGDLAMSFFSLVAVTLCLN